MKKFFLLGSILVSTVCIFSSVGAKFEDNVQTSTNTEQEYCFPEKGIIYKAGITPPRIPTPRPKRMYEECKIINLNVMVKV